MTASSEGVSVVGKAGRTVAPGDVGLGGVGFDAGVWDFHG